MQALQSLFQNYKCIILLFIVSTPLSCQERFIWDIPVEEVVSKLSSSDYTFLNSIDFSQYPDSEILKLNPSAPYYFYYIYKKIEKSQMAVKMLELLLEQGDSIWKEEGILLLLNHYMEQEDYKSAEELASFSLFSDLNPETEQEVKKIYIESIYWQKRDEEVLEMIDKYYLTDHLIQQMDARPELYLFQAVSSCRLNNSGWPLLMERFFLEQPQSSFHSRIYQFFEINPDRYQSLNQDVRDLIEGKYSLVSGIYPDGIEKIKNFIKSIDKTKLETAIIVKELAFAYLSSGKYVEGGNFLVEISEQLPPLKQLEAIEMAGRCFRMANMYGEAIELLRSVTNNSHDTQQMDRCNWFILDMYMDISAEEGLKELIRTKSNYHNMNYFADLIDRLITCLVAEKKHTELDTLYKAFLTGNRLPKYVATRLIYLLIRFGYKSLFNTSEKETGQENDFFSTDYHEYLTRVLYPDLTISYTETEYQEKNYRIENGTEIYDFIFLFFQFGLDDEGYRIILQYVKDMESEALIKAAELLYHKKKYFESITLIKMALERSDIFPSIKNKTLLYPLAFKEQIQKISEGENIPSFLFFSLVRAESGFDPDITSRAGAVGLTQLMPETAEDMAALLNIDEIELTDPEQNLLLGAKYLGKLLKRFSSIPKALMAYNAGPNRMLIWETEFKDTQLDILVESIPYPETRWFVYSIMVSSLSYGQLYFQKSQKEIINMFYPDLENLPD